jgi:hypothetical protein
MPSMDARARPDSHAVSAFVESSRMVTACTPSIAVSAAMRSVSFTDHASPTANGTAV